MSKDKPLERVPYRNITAPNPTSELGRKEGDLSRRWKQGNNQKVSDKAKVREIIFQLRAEGLSYREIANVVGLRFTRVRQIVKANKR